MNLMAISTGAEFWSTNSMMFSWAVASFFSDRAPHQQRWSCRIYGVSDRFSENFQVSNGIQVSVSDRLRRRLVFVWAISLYVSGQQSDAPSKSLQRMSDYKGFWCFHGNLGWWSSMNIWILCELSKFCLKHMSTRWGCSHLIPFIVDRWHFVPLSQVNPHWSRSLMVLQQRLEDGKVEYPNFLAAEKRWKSAPRKSGESGNWPSPQRWASSVWRLFFCLASEKFSLDSHTQHHFHQIFAMMKKFSITNDQRLDD